MSTVQTSTLSNQDISSYLLAATYTADAKRRLIAVVLLDQVQGDGAYLLYHTRQRAGAGAHYMMGPITTFTVPSGQTSVGFNSILIPVESGDVIKIYVKGLAGDTTTVDIVTELHEHVAEQDIRDALKLAPTAGDPAAGSIDKHLDDLPLAGAEMALVNDAITAAKYDESTAFPLKSADTGETHIPRYIDGVNIAPGGIGSSAFAEDAIGVVGIDAAVFAMIADSVLDEAKGAHAGHLAQTPTLADIEAGDLAAIKAKTDTIGSTGAVTIISPVADSGDITIDQGYDYYAADGRALTWTDSTPATWPNLTGATATFYCGELEIVGTITNPTGPATITVELSNLQTTDLPVGWSRFKIDFELSNGHLILQMRGNVQVVD